MLQSDFSQGKIGGIISNPPYIPSHDMSSLQKEVLFHEPSLALDGGGADGMACISVCTLLSRPVGFDGISVQHVE